MALPRNPLLKLISQLVLIARNLMKGKRLGRFLNKGYLLGHIEDAAERTR